MIDRILASLLARKSSELLAAVAERDAVLRACSAAHVTPAKDYWHKSHRLAQEVAVLIKIKETPHE